MLTPCILLTICLCLSKNFNKKSNYCQKFKKNQFDAMEDEELKALRAKRMAEMQSQGVSYKRFAYF